MRILKNKNKGFTLMEAVVSVAIAGIIIVPLSIIFYQALTNISRSKENLKMSQLAQNYIEYAKAVTVDSTNGYSIPSSFTDENEGDYNFYYEKVIEGEEALEEKYKVLIKAYPNVFTLGGNNQVNYIDQFAAVYDRADTKTSIFPIEPIGDMSGDERETSITYEEVEGDPNQIKISYRIQKNLDPTLNFGKTETIGVDQLNGEFVLLYNTVNYDPLTMRDTIIIYNRTHLDLTVYILKNIDVDAFPEVVLKEGKATSIKDSLFEGSNSRRLYKIVVSVESVKTGKEIIMEATKNQRY